MHRRNLGATAGETGVENLLGGVHFAAGLSLLRLVCRSNEPLVFRQLRTTETLQTGDFVQRKNSCCHPRVRWSLKVNIVGSLISHLALDHLCIA